MSLHIEVGRLLAEVREAAKWTQKQVGDALGVHQSRISRMEQGEAADIVDYLRYLEAIASPPAQRLAAALQVSWRHLPRPSLRHPDLDMLIEAESALERLDSFRQGPSIPHVLAGQADLLFRRLYDFGDFLLRLDHKIVYVGEIGVGKTTAACRQSGLVLDAQTARDLKGMLLDTGGGRTTLCDVLVKAGDRFTMQVDPLPDEEVYRLVAELCQAVLDRRDGEITTSQTPDYKPPEEVERALRNMASLPRPTRRKGVPLAVDPAATLAAKSGSPEEFKAEFASRLTLWRRTRRNVDFEGLDPQAGRQWLRETFTAINNGRHPDFTLPGRITITVPFPLVTGTPYEIGLIDTRGVDGSAIRPDIVGHLKDKRALSVLCSKWGSAPDPLLQDLLKHVAETEVDPALFSRVAILVVARSGDALSMRHDSGESAADTDEGYEVKRAHVADALQRISLVGIDVAMFDAANDDPADTTAFLASKINAMRQAQANGGRQTISAIDQMLRNVEKAQALAALTAINSEMQIFADRHQRLKESRKAIYERLVAAVRNSHPRKVWAATRRAGSYWNFDVYQHLGDGAAADAKRRASQPIDGLREIIANKLADPAFETAYGFLEQVLDDVSGWEADFVKAARHHAVAVYKPDLSDASDLWEQCESKYGQRLAYKDEIAAALTKWFDDHEALEEEVDRRIQRAWRTSVVKSLRTAAGGECDLGEAEAA